MTLRLGRPSLSLGTSPRRHGKAMLRMDAGRGKWRSIPSGLNTLKSFGFEEAGEIAGEAGGFGDEVALHVRHPVDEAEAEVARGADQRSIVGKQAVQTVERGCRHGGVEPAPAFVAAEGF